MLWVHDEQFSKEEVLFNHTLLLPGTLQDGRLMGIIPVKADALGRDIADKSVSKQGPAAGSVAGGDNHEVEEKQYLFTPKEMSKEMLARHPKLEVSVAKHVAGVFGFKHRTNVLLASRTAAAVSATHVELSFRDVYLARSDMWRLTVAEISNKTVYKGQKIVFIGTIKATVTNVYVAGRKVQSAFFSTNTKPIFRSESARYVLFIQMSREMWDFDSEGSGEIMFTKVVNGFLPALFKRWVALKARHLVSICLFTRVEYDTGLSNDIKSEVEDCDYFTGYQDRDGNRKPYKDFYRVVVSEMASAQWTDILFQLKHEFRFFRHDITNFRLNNFVTRPENPPEITDWNLGSIPGTRIEAEPTFAIHGNFLEAITLATSQFSSNHIDRDLVRTGISIVVITPGPGLFEVDYERLRSTTDALIGSGIGIELVCLPKIPLHSVPLFRYLNPLFTAYQESRRFKAQGLGSELSTPRQSGTIIGSYSTLHESLSPSKFSGPELQRRLSAVLHHGHGAAHPPDEYSYAIPHWLDVSFWTGASQELLSRHGNILAKDHRNKRGIVKPRKPFAVRCKMYEIEMLGHVENTEISVPLLPDRFRRLGRKEGSDELSLVKVPKRPFAGIGDAIYGPTRNVIDKKSSQADKDLFASLDAFDREAALVPKPEAEPTASEKLEARKKIKIVEGKPPKKPLMNENARLQRTPSHDSVSVRSVTTPSISSKRQATTATSNASSAAASSIPSRSATPTPEAPPTKSMLLSLPFKMSRHISFGFKGFGISAPKAAAASVHKEHANAGPVSSISATTQMLAPPKNSASSMTSHLLSTPLNDNGRPRSAQGSVRSSKGSIAESDDTKKSAQPIDIKGQGPHAEPTSPLQGRAKLGSVFAVASSAGKEDGSVGMPSLQTIISDDTIRVANSKLLAEGVPDSHTLIPSTVPSPWLKVLNPSNPTEANNTASQYTRWQHVFPRPVVTKAMKWKSLCSPAVVPLTTEFFPTRCQLDSDYTQKPYNISQNTEDDMSEVPKTREEFLRELISLRLSQGFQIVIGTGVVEAFGQKVMKIANAFENGEISHDGTCIFLTMGNSIHQLSCVNGTEVEIMMYERKSVAMIERVPKEDKDYKPAIRTHFDDDYVSRVVFLQEPVQEYNWNYVDSYIAGHEEDMTDRIKYWRARFVLIPVDRPTISRANKGEDTEEETRLEGIKALTQIWQRHRVVPPSERRFQSVKAGQRKHPNPLDIWYQTQDPSLAIAAELEGLPILETGDTQPRRGLLSESEHFKKVSVNIAALAESMQQPPEKGGVRMQNRRWHFRLHYNCFIGSDMTTWLMDNFDDIETREEAVEFGNMLMAKEDDLKPGEQGPETKGKSQDVGLFVHVEKRHPFRDGQYFYQIAGQYARQRPSGGGWPFAPRRRDTTLPQTPGAESNPKDSPKPERARSGANSNTNSSEQELRSGAATPTGRRPVVTLSKMMRYDVDPRRRSYRPERINLHYDRIHNPDSCYHIRLEWMNVTAKLIEDSIASWAVTADRYGLMLVEAPLAEACDLASRNPFRRPYAIKLALQPPEKQPATDFNPTSLVAVAQPQRSFYQKAILKKHNFVLDMEAASNFPPTVDVTYSWGRPEYKFSQYIHRSGRVFAQVTDEGNFVLTSNKMYNSRLPQSRDDKFANGIPQTGPPPQHLRQPTPLNSPMLRATMGSPGLRASPAIRPSMAQSQRNSTATIAPVRATVGANSPPHDIKQNLEDFCADVEGLAAFYKEVMDKSGKPSVPPTPQNMRPERDGKDLDDHNIPALGLGPGLFGPHPGAGYQGGSFREGMRGGGHSDVHPVWREGGWGSMRESLREGLRAPPFRKGSEHASDTGSITASTGLGSPLVNVKSNTGSIGDK